MGFSKIIGVINKNESFIITSHIMPDGDSIGSVLAMTAFLARLGKDTFPVINDDIPDRYMFLPGSKYIMRPHDVFCDVVICLDAADESRMGFEKELSGYGKTIVNIDHHKTNDRFAEINYVDPGASSTGEILYNLITSVAQIDLSMALSLYTAILTDTGSIKYSNTSAKTLRILAHLVEIGVKPDAISREVFENRSMESLKLLKLYLDSIEFVENGTIALSYITQNMLEEAGARENDSEGLISWPREVRGVEVAALLVEKKSDVIKVGLRSNGIVDVSGISKELSGGGHSKAAGCTMNMPLGKARDTLLDLIKDHLSRDTDGRNN